MNKAELIERLAKHTGMSPKDTRTAIEALFDTEEGGGLIAAELAGGGKVTISGFGTFECRARKPRRPDPPQPMGRRRQVKAELPARQAAKRPRARPMKSLR